MAVLALAVPLCLLMLAVGVRVLVVTRRGGGTTEQLVGAGFMLMGLGGIPGLFAGHAEIFTPSVQPTFFCIGQLLFSGAFSCFYLFAWRCFGPGTAWRRALALAGVGAQIGAFVALGLVEHFEPPGGAVIRLTALSRGAVMVWAFAESLRYWRLMKRRQGLGLVDPVVTNRFALWSCWTGGLLAMSVVAITARFARNAITLDFSDTFDTLLVSSGLCAATLAVLALTLAFFPPAAYLRYVRRGARA